MTVIVRAARPGDGDAIARAWISAGTCYAELDPDHFQVPKAEGLAELFEEGISHATNDALHLIAELDGVVVGWLSARIEKPSKHASSQFVKEHGWTRLAVDAVIVDRAAWGRGAALLESAESWGRARGADVVRLDTYAQSPVSVPFYEDHLGFRRRSIVFQKRLP